PDSQQHGFSVQASSPLSPLQRFGVLKFSILYHEKPSIVNVKFSFYYNKLQQHITDRKILPTKNRQSHQWKTGDFSSL
ncbi:MAG: hypothetical protein UDG94_07560, partial [Peptococcaceae bacterium]|nr:hypothetical protein [Peptococcaceae bacterium]